MITFSKAYENCKKAFISSGYKGIGMIRQTDDAWVFSPLTEVPSYGDLPAIFPKDGTEPFYLQWEPDMVDKYLRKSTIIG